MYGKIFIERDRSFKWIPIPREINYWLSVEDYPTSQKKIMIQKKDRRKNCLNETEVTKRRWT